MPAAKPAAKTATKPQKPAQDAPEYKGSALVPIGSAGALAASLGADFVQELGAEAKAVAAGERPTTTKLSIQGGILTYNGAEMPDNELNVVIVAHGYENAFHIDKYDPNVIKNPRCFALAMPNPDGSAPDMVSHENVLDTDEDEHPGSGSKCADCPNHEWGSDPGGGRGKACKERRRIVMMPEDALSDPDLVAKAELAFLSLPVMSVKLWAAYINKLNAATHLPYYAVVTRMFVKPDKRSQYVVDYEAKFVISDPLVLRAVMARREEAARICLTPFDTYSYDEEQQAPPARKGAAPSKRKF